MVFRYQILLKTYNCRKARIKKCAITMHYTVSLLFKDPCPILSKRASKHTHLETSNWLLYNIDNLHTVGLDWMTTVC
jgi:hypothetical protein